MTPEKPRSLIVDDETFNLHFLTELLIHDCDISPIKDSNKTLELTEALLPDLIILDVVMPGMDGYTVIRALKSNPKTNHIPVIFLTSLDSDEDEEKGLSLGAVDYISKPFRPAIVKARVHNILELVQHRKLVEKIAMLDGLTGIPNRRAYDERLMNEWQRACRNGEPFSLALMDVDFFKPYNDTYGHAAGDLALKKIAQSVNQTLKRSSDFVGRYGGEEFALILPSLPFRDAQIFADHTCLEIQKLGIEHKASNIAKTITISIGGSTTVLTRNCQLLNFARHVDDMLYKAKESRNCAVWTFFKQS